jgi:hypothetical protein
MLLEKFMPTSFLELPVESGQLGELRGLGNCIVGRGEVFVAGIFGGFEEAGAGCPRDRL